MRYGSKVLFDDVTTTFVAGRRYGLTGPNGAGKSTFMKLLTGELEPQRGTVARPGKIGVLRQDHYAFDAFRVIDTVIMGNRRLWEALQERERLYSKTDMTDADGIVLYSKGTDFLMMAYGLRPGFDWSERTMGTNGENAR